MALRNLWLVRSGVVQDGVGLGGSRAFCDAPGMDGAVGGLGSLLGWGAEAWRHFLRIGAISVRRKIEPVSNDYLLADR